MRGTAPPAGLSRVPSVRLPTANVNAAKAGGPRYPRGPGSTYVTLTSIVPAIRIAVALRAMPQSIARNTRLTRVPSFEILEGHRKVMTDATTPAVKRTNAEHAITPNKVGTRQT
jgi:hypothetical protein